MATGSSDTTSAGMPPIETTPIEAKPSALAAADSASDTGGSFAGTAHKVRASAGGKVRGIADEGKAQVTQTLDGIVEAARDLAARLESTGVAPAAKYAHQAVDLFAGWSTAVDRKSVDDLVDDARTLVRTSPAVAVGIAVAAGFVLSRFLKATSPAGTLASRERGF